MENLDQFLQLISIFGIGSAMSLALKTAIEKIAKHKKEKIELKSSDLEVQMKHDQYWENRFNGLKIDYDSREKYHREQYELIKKTYEEKEAFLQSCIDKFKSDYSILSDDYDELIVKYDKVANENIELKSEIATLKARCTAHLRLLGKTQAEVEKDIINGTNS